MTPRFVVVLEHKTPSDRIATQMMTDEEDFVCRFETREAAREAARGAMWEHAWDWWIVELTDEGRTVYGSEMP